MKKHHVIQSLIFILLLILVLFSVCSPKSKLQSYQVTRFAMGTVIEITVLDDSEKHAYESIDAAFEEISRIGSLFYEGNPESPLYEFSHRTSNNVRMPNEVLRLIQRGLKISELTDGCFDMTVGIILPLYNFKTESPAPPALEEIDALLPYVDYRSLNVDLECGVLISASPKTMLTTGGIAKGYGVDRAIAILKDKGVKGALVNAGGDLRALPRGDGKKWRVGIQDPRDLEKMLKIIEVDSGAVITSGDYQKYFFYNGKRYHHLINPKTGLPADSCQSVTILAPTAEMADALATGIFVAGVSKGLEILNSLPDCDGLIVRYDGKFFSTADF
ncbi:MAG: FAD:protein FMN transferase [Candidatus Marinimicrobia bacterium]|nr:FAD:protein FMN transferase [bacterium]MCG2716474.1 FAD:protein FMN transferase [Candidatus Neomarinimicrobiota bacterium]